MLPLRWYDVKTRYVYKKLIHTCGFILSKHFRHYLAMSLIPQKIQYLGKLFEEHDEIFYIVQPNM